MMHLQIVHFADCPHYRSSLFLFPVKRSRFAAGRPECLKRFGDLQLVHARYSSEREGFALSLSSFAVTPGAWEVSSF